MREVMVEIEHTHGINLKELQVGPRGLPLACTSSASVDARVLRDLLVHTPLVQAALVEADARAERNKGENTSLRDQVSS
jgi:hypothetical protein